MLFAFFFCILLLAATVHSAPAIDDDIESTCNAEIEHYSQCTARVESVDRCTSAILNFTGTPSAKCSGINYLWAQPANNLTMIIETPYTQERQTYRIVFDNDYLMELVTNAYQIINNEEINVTTHTSTLTLKSDSSFQVVVKFETPAESTVSAIVVRYEVAKS